MFMSRVLRPLRSGRQPVGDRSCGDPVPFHGPMNIEPIVHALLAVSCSVAEGIRQIQAGDAVPVEVLAKRSIKCHLLFNVPYTQMLPTVHVLWMDDVRKRQV